MRDHPGGVDLAALDALEQRAQVPLDVALPGLQGQGAGEWDCLQVAVTATAAYPASRMGGVGARWAGLGARPTTNVGQAILWISREVVTPSREWLWPSG